ncbi:MAG: sensor histidine kinase [Myxococcota bacterium]
MADGSLAPRPVRSEAAGTRSLHGVGLAAALALLVANVLLSTFSARRVATAHESAIEAQEALATLRRLGTRVVDAESAQRGYILTGGEQYLEPWIEAGPDIDRLLADLDAHVRDEPVLHARVQTLRGAIEVRTTRLREGVLHRQQEGLDAAMRHVLGGGGLAAMAEVRTELATLERELDRRFDTANAHAKRSTQLARTTFAVANAVAGTMLAMLYLLVRRNEATRERAAAGLRESEERLRMVVDNAPVLLLVCDRDGILRLQRGKALAALGLLPMQRVGDPCAEVFADHPALVDHLKRGLAGEASSALLELEGKTLEMYFRPVRRDGGDVEGVLGMALDVTERVDAERRLREATEELERRVVSRTAELEAANKELESFSYSVSHDLRAPLRSIDGFGAAIEEECGGALSPTCRTYMTRLRAATRRMAQLIEDLLKLSRVTRAGLHRERVDMSGLARSILEDLAHADPARDVRVEVEDGLVAVGDTHLLRILLENLLSNAWKFTSRTPGAAIRFSREGDAFCLADNGAGFDMAYVHRLFAPFQRLHGVEEFEGTGIGLATVNRIVGRHGGRVWAEAEPGKGATFRFTLPDEQT